MNQIYVYQLYIVVINFINIFFFIMIIKHLKTIDKNQIFP